MKGMRRSLALLALAVLSLSGCIVEDDGGGDFVHQTVHERFALARNAHIRVGNVSGSILVVPWTNRAIDIVARKESDDSDALHRTAIEITHDGTPATDVDVETHYHRDGFFWFGGSGANVDYTLHVPSDVSLRLSNVSGNIRVSDVTGDVDANAVSGDVNAKNLGGELHVRTVSGSVEASVTRMNQDSYVSIEAVSGSIDLAIPSRSSASVTADSISGDFDSDFNIPTEHRTVGVQANGNIGSGAGTIELKTISGSMTLSKT